MSKADDKEEGDEFEDADEGVIEDEEPHKMGPRDYYKSPSKMHH